MTRSQGGKQIFTLVVVPHSSEADVATFRVPLFWIQLSCVLVVATFVGLLVFFNTYFAMVDRMDELSRLRFVNRQQRDQLLALSDQARDLRGRLRELYELERQVREAVVLFEQETPVTVASAGRSSGALPEADEPFRGSLEFLEAIGPSRPTGGTATATRIVDDPALRDADEITRTFDLIRQALPQQKLELEQLRQTLVEETARREATPLIWPVRGLITSGFGLRRSPFGRGYEMHLGLDIARPHGTPVVATARGRVVFSGYDGGYGNVVIIEHGYGYQTTYGHNSRIVVRTGDRVERGDVIAYVGSTGRSTGPHLHYEVHVNGRPVDPRPFLLNGR